MFSIANNREEDPNFLDDELLQVELHFKRKDERNLAVSQANVGWQLDHSLKTINEICKALANSNPEEYTSKFNVQRIVVHTFGFIPRGEAQAPKNVRPPNKVRLDSLKLQLTIAKQNLNTISSLDKNAFFAHPVFDHLDRDQTRRFLKIHTNHHLKIIADILGE